jgi:hypothetical protein
MDKADVGAPEGDNVDFATALGIEQSPERVKELLPAVAVFMTDVAALWSIDLDGCESATRFNPADAW